MTVAYDLHVHTDASACSASAPADIVDAAVAAGLDGIAITDHDTMANVEVVAAAAPPSLEVIPGVEVSTTAGHILALDVDRCPTGDTPTDVIDDIHEQGGFAVPAHPFDRFRRNGHESIDPYVDHCDAVEVINSRCLLGRDNDKASHVAHDHGLAVTGGSDAHFPFELGRAYTIADEPLRDALAAGTTDAVGTGRYLTGHVATKLLKLAP